MNKEQHMVYELLETLKRESIGDIELLHLTSSLLCLGYGIVNENIQGFTLDDIMRSDNPQIALQQSIEELEDKVFFLEGAFSNGSFSKLSNETLKKVVALLKGSDLDSIEYRNSMEWLIQWGTERIGKVEGIFDAPLSIKKLMVGLFEQYEGTVYDATSGLCGNLIEYISKVQEPELLEVYGQEMHNELCQISKIRLYLNNIQKCYIECQNSLVHPYIDNKTSSIRKYDSILMNIPFGMSWKEYEEKIRRDTYSIYMYGMPSVANADWLFMSLAVSSLNKNGKAVVVTTLGSLFRGGAEEKIRQNLISFDYIDSIIQLPSSLFDDTNIPVAVVVFNKNKVAEMKNKIQFINASEKFELIKRGRRVLADSIVNEIIDMYKTKQQIDEVSVLVSTNEIEGANLLPSKYVQSLVFDSTSLGKVRIHEERMKFTKRMCDIGMFYRGINITSKYVQTQDGNYKVINYGDVKNGELDIKSVQKYSIQNNARVEAYRVQAGDLIISNKGVTKICVIPEHEGDILISQNFIGIRLNEGYNARYIQEYLVSPLGEFLLERQKTGTAIQMISAKDLQEIPLVINEKSSQNEIMKEYESKEKVLKNELLAIQEKLDELKTELYNKMEISSIVEMEIM